jgi:hypothetical protein
MAVCGFEAVEDNISVAELRSLPQQPLAAFEFRYTNKELDSYLVWRTVELNHKSCVWIKKAAEVF